MNKFSVIIAFCLLGIHTLSGQDWIKILAGPQSKIPSKTLRLPNGDFIIGGLINDAGQIYNQSGLVIRTNPAGEVKWETRIGGVDAEGNFTANERIEDMALSSDGYILVVGKRSPPQSGAYAQSDVLIAKLDLTGAEIWRHYFDWNYTDNGFGITALPNGEMVICGNSTSPTTSDLDGILCKINPAGDALWVKYFDTGLVPDWLYGVILTSDQHLVAVGSSETAAAGNRVWVMQTDLEGDLNWSYTYPAYALKANAVVEHQNGHYGICGLGYGPGGGFDNLVMEIDKNGHTVWGKNYHSYIGFTDELFDLIPCAEGGYAAVGISGIEAFDGYHLLRVNETGDSLKTSFLLDGPPYSEFAKSLTWASDGGLLVTGAQLKQTGDYELLITHFSDFGCTQPTTSATLEAPTISVKISPNPSSDFILVDAGETMADPFRFEIYNAAGKLVFSNPVSPAQFSIDCRKFPVGAYFYMLRTEDGASGNGRLMIQR